MNRRVRIAVSLTLFLAAASPASGQTTALPPDVQKALEARRAEIDRMQKTAKDPTATQSTLAMMPARLRVEAGTITDARSSIGAGSLTIQLTIFTEEIPANAFIRRHEIVSAVDDQGRPVAQSTNVAAGAGLQPRGDSPRLMRPLVFQAPPRRAESIKSIEGNLEMFVPGEDTGSLVKFAGIAGYAGKQFTHPILAKNDIEITALTKEMYEALKPQWEKSAASVAQPPNFMNSAVFLLKDKNGRFGGLELREPDGNVNQSFLQTFSTNVLGTAVVVARANTPIRPDTEIRFLVADPAALRLFPFRLENISLP